MTRQRAINGRRLLIASMVMAAAVVAEAQWRGRYREGSFAPRYAPARMPDADFTICRLEYNRGS
jgi:hypothetical protein